MSALIEVKNINKHYQDTKVTDEISFSVSAGEILGIVGPNGAGKTTCLQAILGLVDFQGDIRVLDYDPKTQRSEMLKEVAYIADVAVLPKWLKVGQALQYMQGVHCNFNIDKAREFLAKTNILEKSKISTLSKGMVTQLHLALILAIDAKVLILDEPTLGLDILTRKQFYQHLLEDFYNEEKCIIVTTHQIEEIEHILTNVAFIQSGKLVLNESTEAIRERFSLVTVAEPELEEAKRYSPLFTNSLMGLTTMLFDGQESSNLAKLGNITVPSLADIFVGVMTEETS